MLFNERAVLAAVIRDVVLSPNLADTLAAAPNGAPIIPGAKPAKCPRFLKIASYSLSGVSPIFNVVKPSINPEPRSVNASDILNSPL